MNHAIRNITLSLTALIMADAGTAFIAGEISRKSNLGYNFTNYAGNTNIKYNKFRWR